MTTRDRGDWRSLLDGLDEPALIIERRIVRLANAAARVLLGRTIEGSDVRLAIRHPQALEFIFAEVPGDLEISGIGDFGRPWRLLLRSVGNGIQLLRLIDRSVAQAAEKMRVDFVANASHELRTPLAALIGYTETLQEKPADIDDTTRERFLGVIHDEAQRMQSVVEDLISLSRIEADRYSTPTEEVDLGPLIRQTVGTWKRAADERGSRLDVRTASELPPVSADTTQILQLLDNLVTNALRYGTAGTPITISAESDGKMVHLTVADEGEGIAPEHIKRVTERFYRVDTSRSRALGGTGLGLSIVKHIVERHRGQLTIESQLGKGTTVHVLLPAVLS